MESRPNRFDASIVGYNGGLDCGPKGGYFPACTNAGKSYYYLQCIQHHLKRLTDQSYNFDCAGPATAPPDVLDRKQKQAIKDSPEELPADA